MRVLSSAKWVWSFAVSGGMVLVLSGSAMASEVMTDEGKQAVQTAHTVTTVESSGTGEVQVVVTQDSQTQSEAGEVAAEPTTEQTAVNTQINDDAVAAAVTAEAPTPVEVKTSPADVAVTGSLVAPVAEVTASSKELATVKPVSAVSAVVYQPKRPITASAVATTVKDMAASQPMPTAATDTDSPLAPAQPTGVLGHLSAQLAGSVVKPVYMPMAATLGTSMFTLMLLLTLLNRSKIVKIFADGARREGFAYAPRSDVAAATFNSYFATPFSMSYVMAIRQSKAHF